MQLAPKELSHGMCWGGPEGYEAAPGAAWSKRRPWPSVPTAWTMTVATLPCCVTMMDTSTWPHGPSLPSDSHSYSTT